MKITKQLLNLRDTLKIMRGNLNSAYTGLKYLEDAVARLDLLTSPAIDIERIKEQIDKAWRDTGLHEYMEREDFYDHVRGEILAYIKEQQDEILKEVNVEAEYAAERYLEELAPPEESEALTLEERNK